MTTAALSRTLSAIGAAALLASNALGCAATTSDATESGAGAIEQSGKGHSLGHYEGVRAGGEAKMHVDTQKLTYTKRGSLTLHVAFEPSSSDEGSDVPEADLLQASFDLTFDEYVTLFESSGSASIPRHRGQVYAESAEASGPEDHRKLTFHWDNADDENTRRSDLEIELGPQGRITSLQLTKQAKRLFGWKTVFDAKVARPTRSDGGLLLLDDGPVGRVQDEARIRHALDNPSPQNFAELVVSGQPR